MCNLRLTAVRHTPTSAPRRGERFYLRRHHSEQLTALSEPAYRRATGENDSIAPTPAARGVTYSTKRQTPEVYGLIMYQTLSV